MDLFCRRGIDPDLRDKALVVIQRDVRRGEVSLIHAVESIGQYLTSDNEDIRTYSTRLLTQGLIRQLNLYPPENTNDEAARGGGGGDDTLRMHQVHTLCIFYAERLHDFKCLADLLPGLIHIVEQFSPVPEDVQFVLNQIFNEVNAQSLSQQPRLLIYELLEVIIRDYPALCSSLDFITGFTQCIDGERDPRNLMAVFSLEVTLCNLPEAQSPIQYLAEDFFDAISCYFPITFTPPPESTITLEQLVDSLGRALIAHKSFAQFCIPMLLEKCSSALVATKIESLTRLGTCSTFGLPELKPFLEEVYSTLRTELLRSSNPAIVNAALVSLAQIINVSCKDSPDDKSAMEIIAGAVHPVIQDLKSPECKFAKIYANMLNFAASASDRSCNILCRRLLPELVAIFYEHVVPPTREGVITIIIALVEAIFAVLVAPTNAPNASESLKQLVPMLEQVWDAVASCTSDENHPRIVIAAMKAASRLILFHKHLPRDISPIVAVIRHNLIEASEEIRDNLIESLCWTCNRDPKLIERHFLAVIFEQFAALNAERPSNAAAFELRSLILTRIGKSCPPSCPYIVDQILSRSIQYEHVISGAGGASFLLATVNALLEEQDSQKNAVVLPPNAGSRCAIRLLMLAAEANTKGDALPQTEAAHASITCHRLMRQLPSSVQASIFRIVLRAILPPSASATGETQDETTSMLCQQIDEIRVQKKWGFIPFFAAVFLASTREVINDAALFDQLAFADIACDMILSVDQPDTRLHMAHCFASLINKIQDTTLMDTLCNRHVEGRLCAAASLSVPTDPEIDVEDEYVPDSTVHGARLRIVPVLAWMIKALALRCAMTQIIRFSSILVQLLTSHDFAVSTTAATGFQTIMGDHPDVLHKRTFANVPLLYKQRNFALQMPALFRNLEHLRQRKSAHSISSEGPTLLALGFMLENVPKTAILNEVDKILPLVVRALTLFSLSSLEQTHDEDQIKSDANMYHAALRTLRILIIEAHEKCAKQLNVIVPALINLTRYDPSMEVRMEALNCILQVRAIPVERLLLLRDTITTGLVPALDDRKRKVRKLAVKCRNEWFLVAD